MTFDLPPPLAAIWPAVRAALAAGRHVSPVGAVQWSPRVWKLTRADGGGAMAVKLAADEDGVGGEPATLRFLHERGAPVPEVLAMPSQAPRAWLVTKWCGDVTIDDIAQSADVADLDVLGRSLADAVLAVEAALDDQAGPRALAAAESARTALCHQMDSWWHAAPQVLEWITGSRQVADNLAAIEEIRALAISCVPRLGSLDYNPRNVVVGAQGLILVDFSACGFDWRERRFAQYGTAVGAGRRDGAFVSVLTPVAARHYARVAQAQTGGNQEDTLARLDAHDLALLLAATTQLHLVEQGQAHPERAAAWHDVPARKEQLLTLLRRRLTPDGPAERLRALLR